ncbi:MAG TPA: radical SAM protein, partial [Alphaproteobacteria bacterium]
KVYLSVTTLDAALARRLEPRAAAPAKRLAAMRALAGAGIPTGVMVAPVIPGLTDHEIDSILAAAAEAGAVGAGYVLLRLPLEVKDLFAEWLAAHYPDRARRVLALVRETRGGALNDAAFGKRMRGTGAYAELIARRFRAAAGRLGLTGDGGDGLDCTRFAPPARTGEQLALF